MTKFSVIVTRTTVEWTMVDSEAETAKVAAAMAIEKVKSDASAFDWDWDSSEFSYDDVEDLEETEEDEQAPSVASA
jgi:hypothetical protein